MLVEPPVCLETAPIPNLMSISRLIAAQIPSSSLTRSLLLTGLLLIAGPWFAAPSLAAAARAQADASSARPKTASPPKQACGVLSQIDASVVNNPDTLKIWGTDAETYTYEGHRVRTTDLTYYSHDYQGRSVRIFGYFSRPADPPPHSVPGLLIVHGAGGYAVRERAEEAAARGYAALAIDLPGQGAGRGRSRSGGPDMTVTNLFRTSPRLQDNYLYQSLLAARRGLTMLLDCPETDPKRLGIYGMSWGGVITLLTCATDRRVTAAVNLYGGGYLLDGSTWIEHIVALTKSDRARWYQNFDPSLYVPLIRCPVLSITGTNDGCFWLPGFVQTQAGMNGQSRLLLLPNFNHKIDSVGRNALWAWLESGLKYGKAPQEKILGWKYENEPQGLHFSVWTKGENEPTRMTFTRLVQGRGWASVLWQSYATGKTGDRFDIWVPKTIKPQYLYATAYYESGLTVSTPVYAIWSADYPYGRRYYDSPLMAKGTYFARVERLAMDMGAQPAAPSPGDTSFEIRYGSKLVRIPIQVFDGRRYAQVRDVATAVGASLYWQQAGVVIRPPLRPSANTDTPLGPNAAPGPHNPLFGEAAIFERAMPTPGM
jgi:dienelactone hydrolase